MTQQGQYTPEQPSAPMPVMQSLKELLLQETTTYRQVVDVMKDKSRILVEGDYKQLPALDQQLVQLGQKSLHLEHERIGLMQEVSHSENTLQQIIFQLPVGEERTRLLEIRTQLLEAVEQIRLLNQDHKRLLNHSIKWVSETLRVVNVSNTPEPVSYQAKAGKNASLKPNASKPVQSTVIRDA